MIHSHATTKKHGKWLEKASRLLAIGSVLCVLIGCAPESQPSTDLSSTSQSLYEEQVVFATPEQAVDALVTATREDQRDDLLKILGPNAHQVIYSGDKVADIESRNKFISAYDRAHEIRNDNTEHATLVVGEEEWPLPIPLVHVDNGWWFDTAAGQEEILNRRIGRNELNVLEVCRVYVEAQQAFSALHTHGKHQHEYAQHFESSPGQHNGLYWPAADNQPPSPLGPFLASAAEEGYSGKVLSKRTPYHGYYYRILKSQSSHASGGAKDYIVHGHMRNGFALIAFPARYGDSGVMTFIVNQDGIIYEKNLGFTTDEVARVTREFDPDDSWNVVQ
jgi:hypothetical protein